MANVTPSENSAATYCFPPTTNDGLGASSPGWVAFTVTVYALLAPAAVVTISDWEPVLTLDGT
jgi:hypothetical protein